MPSEYDPNETARDWETLQHDADVSTTQRLRIQGGWLYRVVAANGAMSMVFVPIASESTDA